MPQPAAPQTAAPPPATTESAAPPAIPSARGLRLRRHADFQQTYSRSRKQYGKEMSFFFALRTSPDAVPPKPARRFALAEPAGPRIGLTVGKVMGGAVDRNRIKRRLREAVRRHAPLLGGMPIDVILHPRKSVLTLDWTVLEREVAQVFRTIRKLAAKSAAAPAATRG